MDNSALLAISLVFGGIFISRVVMEKANRKLTTDQKAGLVDLFSKYRVQNIVITVSLMAVFFVSLKLNLLAPKLLISTFFGSFLLFLIVSVYRSTRLLKTEAYPLSYRNTVVMVTTLRLVGFIAAGFLLMMQASH